MKSDKIFLYFAMLALLLACSCKQQEAPMRVFGLADIYLGCTIDCPPPITAYKHPDAGVETIGIIDAKDSESWPVAEEFEYEKSGLLVHAKTGDWYAITLKEKEGWIYKDAIKTFYPYPEILKNRLAYYALPQGHIYTEPSIASDIILPVINSSSLNQNEPAIDVLNVRIVDGEWWINANILSDSPCTSSDKKILTTGWFPAIIDGQRTAWFYSRGC